MARFQLTNTGFLRGKLAKRIFVLFVASALVPILMLAALYHFQGSVLLLEHAQGQLRGASVTYSTALYDRLVLADDALRSVGEELARGTSINELRPTVGATFSGLDLLPFESAIGLNNIDSRWSGLDSPQVRQQVLIGETALLTMARDNQQARILMVRLADAANPSRGILSAEVRRQYLWAEREANPYLTELCVFDHRYRPLSCTQSFELTGLPAALQKKPLSVSGDLDWQDDTDAYVAQYREVFLEARFTVPRWIVVAGQRRSDALDSLKTFEMTFWASLAVSTLLALLLSSVQIRRTMDPLEKLIHGTSQLSRRDFSTQVEITSGDEFQLLATSFNTMATRLGRQFDVMTTLSSIDRAILYELDIDRLMEEVLLSLRSMYSLECAGIVVIDREAHDRVRLFSITADRNQPMAKHTRGGTDSRDMLLANTDGYWATPEEIGWRGLACKDNSRARHMFSFPIGSKSGPGGQLMLGFEHRTELDDDDIGYIREFADRIGVALSSAARDEQLFRQARYDGLTGLPNRFLLLERLKQEVAQAQRLDR
ncbi:MAG: HAMP domain-containing protein, partial [Burkholderiales bacterium]